MADTAMMEAMTAGQASTPLLLGVAGSPAVKKAGQRDDQHGRPQEFGTGGPGAAHGSAGG